MPAAQVDLGHPLLQLQRVWGNRRARQMFEASATAGDHIQRACTDCDDELQRKADPTIRRRVRAGYVSCGSNVAPDPVLTAIGTNDPVGTLTAADTRAIEMLDAVIDELAYTQGQIRGGQPAASPTISDAVAVSLRTRFGIDPDNEDVWTSTRYRTTGGSATVTLLLVRLRAVRRILAGGWIRYTCLAGDCDPGDWAYTYEGEYRIYLCQPFWPAGVDDQAVTLLHEAFHIYFGATDSGRHMWNAHCIEQFVADFNGVAIQPGFAASCS